MDCIFCDIVKKKIPAYKLYEDDDIISILDINPVSSGHSLIIPKKHYATFLETPKDILNKIMGKSYAIVEGITKAMNSEGYNLLINNNSCSGQVIPHIHIHVIPRKENDGASLNWKTFSCQDKEFAGTFKLIKDCININNQKNEN